VAKPKNLVQPVAQLAETDGSIASVEKLQKNAIGSVGLIAGATGAVAPLAAMFFNVPSIVTQAGAATPLVFLIAAIGMILFAVSLVYFARRINSAGGLYSWVSISLGPGAGYSAGWLMLGGYALFEAAAAAAFGGLTDNTLSSLFNVHLVGGWATYALLAIVVVSALTYFDIKWSARVLTPFLVLEVGSLLVLDLAIIVRGGASGHDLVHTFTTAGTALKGVFPGGFLGIGVGMALAVWSFVGAEQGVAFGEEVRFPRKAIPYGLFGVFAGVGILFILTTYAAVIGLGWQDTVNTLGNLANAPTPYFNLADRYVGGWLTPVLYVTISTSTFASIIAFHNGMIRYFYALGREQVLPQWLGKTHPRWKSPYIASLVQSVFSLLVIVFLALIIQHTNADGSTSYALGIADGKNYQQTNGIASYGWLAIIGTLNFIVVYILVNIAAPFYARRHNEFRVLAHVVAPLLSTLVLLIPFASFVFPGIPGPIGAYFTGLGFFATPFPLNILSIFPLLWLLLGWLYAAYLIKTNRGRFERLGRIVQGENDLEVIALAKVSTEV
jgi:amino acid transporter